MSALEITTRIRGPVPDYQVRVLRPYKVSLASSIPSSTFFHYLDRLRLRCFVDQIICAPVLALPEQ